VAVLYLAMRTAVIGLRFTGQSTDVLNQPYILATTAQKYATIAYVQLRYIGLLVWPHPLAFDYGYQQIPYQNWTSPGVLVSLVVHAGLGVAAVVGLARRWVVAYGIWFYLASISIFSNIVFNLGGTMGERFLFQPSVGFAIALGAVVGVALSRLPDVKLQKKLFLGLVVLILVPSCLKVWARNPAWKDNQTLFLTDVETVPMSAKAQKGAGEALLKMGRDDSLGHHNKPLLERALGHYNRALELHPKFVDAWLDKGATLYMLDRYAECEAAWNQAEALNPHNSTLRKHYDILALYFHSVAQRKFSNRDYDSTVYYCQKAIRYERTTGKPWHLKATALGMMQKFPEALAALDTALAYEPRNAQYWYDKGGIAYNGRDYATAAAAMEQTLRIDPNFPQAAEALRAARQRLQFPAP
jgi:Flp pilus assembly protein TadD